MYYEEYKETLIRTLKEKLGSNIKIENIAHKVNNNIDRDGIIIRMGRTADPIIYVDSFYKKFCAGDNLTAQIEEIMAIVLNEDTNIQNVCHTILNGTWNDIKDKIRIEVINLNWNKFNLERIPYENFLNLAIVFRIMFNTKTSCIVTNALLEHWNIPKEELIKIAYSNLNTIEYPIQKLTEQYKNEIDEILLIENLHNVPIYAMSSKFNILGASGILRTDLLKEFAETIGEDIFIIPNSIHTLLLIPATNSIEPLYLKQTIEEKQRMIVDKEYLLSDSIYFFKRKNCEVQIIL